jgi:adenylate kinase
VSQDELVRRLMERAQKEGRADDNEETIRVRMRVYEEQTAPLLNYYRERGLLVEVDGEQPIDDVFDDLLTVVEKSE